MAGEGLPVAAPKRPWFRGVAHRGADRDELQVLGFGAVLAPFQADTDDTVGAQCVGFGLHAGHGIPARPIRRLGEHRKLGLLPDTGELVAHVVDRDTHHEIERLETGPVQKCEFVDRQVRGEDLVGVRQPFAGNGVERGR